MRPTPERIRSAPAALLSFVLIVLAGAPPAAGSSWRGLTDVIPVDETAEKALSLHGLSRGHEVEIITREGVRLHGRYRGLARMPAPAYAARLDSAWVSAGAGEHPPAPGDRITVRPRHGRSWDGRLEGYAFRGVEVARDGKPVSVMPFGSFAALSDSGHREWTATELDDEAGAGRLPAFSVMVVELYGEERRVPTDRIREVSYESADGSTIVVVAVSAALLAVFLIGAAYSHGWWFSPPWN